MPTFTLSRSRALVLVAAAAAVVLLAARFVLPPAPAPVPAGPAGPAGPGTPPTAAGILPPAPGGAPPAAVVVDVTGAVRRPGLYRFRQGARVADALERAGGPTRRADTALVNLAQLLADGEQVRVPARAGPATAGGGASAASGASQSGPVHLNSATVADLDALPGVGPVTAQKIVDYRHAHGAFASVDELDAIPGIGPARLDDLRDLVAP